VYFSWHGFLHLSYQWWDQRLGDCADSGGRAANNQAAIKDLGMPCGKNFNIVIAARFLKLLKYERPSQ
jgi:hypothetical protein